MNLGEKLFEIEQRAKAVAHTAVAARTGGGVSEEMIRELVDVIDRLWKAAEPLRLE